MRRHAPRSRPGSERARLAAALVAAAALWLSVGGLAAHRAIADAPVHLHAAAKNDVDGVTKRLMCMCGCNLTVKSCRASMTCDISARMTAQVTDLLDKGMTQNEALDAMAADYGERVLAAPTKKGFNLTAWILPFVALALGAVVVAFVLRGWRGRPTPQVEAPAPVDDETLALVEDEIRRGM